ncbi:SPOR domain-containing protein [Glaciecola sp. XM2]|uniref:SPOR domain-containing protein n=1 Tax=Glaciecola sp. XM2 TaxID=1914931 RepID=UPI001BDDEDF9|nr:SPOR domain-containing protein [Glaciecola sp. XM2]MBT1450862.1 SPOR domain-containing protein [Glaciecola sp. XM2]
MSKKSKYAKTLTRVLNMPKPTLFIIVTFLLLLISGCSSLSKVGTSQSVKNFEEQASLRQSEELSAIIEEWATMKPALINLISLESDLQYMLNNIDQTNDTLPSSAELQKAIESEEELLAYETMSFSDAKDITGDFDAETVEAEKFSKASVFADETLLQELQNSVATKSTDLPPLASEEVPLTPAIELNLASQNLDLENTDVSESNAPKVKAVAPVAKYLREDAQAQDSLPIQDVRAVGVDELQPNSTQVPQRKSSFETIVSTATDNDIDGKFKTSPSDEGIPDSIMDAKFKQQNIDPRDIVGGVSKFSSQVNRNNNINTSGECRIARQELIGKGYALHLASYSSMQAAIEGWKNLSSDYADELCGLVAATELVTVNNKLFYSLRAGGFASKDTADEACQKLTSENQYCRSTKFVGKRLP